MFNSAVQSCMTNYFCLCHLGSREFSLAKIIFSCNLSNGSIGLSNKRCWEMLENSQKKG